VVDALESTEIDVDDGSIMSAVLYVFTKRIFHDNIEEWRERTTFS